MRPSIKRDGYIIFRGFRIDATRDGYRIRNRDMQSYTIGSHPTLTDAKQRLIDAGVYN